MKTDAQLKSAIQDELDWEPTISSGDFDVVTKEGIVTLSGTVPHYVEKSALRRPFPSIPTRSVSEGSSCCAKSLTDVSGWNFKAWKYPEVNLGLFLRSVAKKNLLILLRKMLHSCRWREG